MNAFENIGHLVGVIVWMLVSIVLAFVGMTMNSVFIMGLGLGLIGVVLVWYLAVLPQLFE